MEGVNYNVSYNAYYLNINISKTNCIFFEYNNVNIYTNISEFFGSNILRDQALNYFEKYIIDNVEDNFLEKVLDEFNYHINLN